MHVQIINLFSPKILDEYKFLCKKRDFSFVKEINVIYDKKKYLLFINMNLSF